MIIMYAIYHQTLHSGLQYLLQWIPKVFNRDEIHTTFGLHWFVHNSANNTQIKKDQLVSTFSLNRWAINVAGTADLGH